MCDAANAARQLLARAAEPVAAMAERLAERNRYMLIGRGYSMASAKEGALKLMETASLPASGWSAAEAIHGPLGQVVPGTVVIPLTASPSGRASVLDFAAAARDRGGTIVEVGTGTSNPEPLAATWSLRFQALGAVPEQMVPLLEVIPLQMLALELSIRAGKDPDNPPGLKKVSRTV